MQTTISSTIDVVRKFLRDGSNLATLLVVVGTSASLVFMLYVGIGTARTIVSAPRVDTLQAERAVRELDEAAFAATWAQLRATTPAAITVVTGVECAGGCVRMIWPDGTAVTVDLTAALDYAGLCSCPMVVQSPERHRTVGFTIQ